MSKIIIISAPSGSGKSTIIKSLKHKHPEIQLSTSATTRNIRPGEVNGKDYFFITDQEFDEARDKGLFIEHVQGPTSRYGTLASTVEDLLSKNKWIIFDIEPKGMLKIKDFFKKNRPNIPLYDIMVLPPSWKQLKERICNRGTDSDEDIDARLTHAKTELEHSLQYTYALINNTLEDCVHNFSQTISARPESLQKAQHPEMFEHEHAETLLKTFDPREWRKRTT